MGFFDGARETGIGNDSNKIKPGQYDFVRIDEMKIVQGHHGTRLIAKFTPLVDGKPVGTQPDGKDYTPNAAGVGGDWASGDLRGQYAKASKAECNGLAYAVLGTEDMVVLEQALEGCVSPSQPWRGKIIALTAYRKKTGRGNFMDKCTFSPAEGAPPASAVSIPAAALSTDAPVPAPAPAPVAFPPEGWDAHPTSPGWFYKGQDVKNEADLRAMMAAGTA